MSLRLPVGISEIGDDSLTQRLLSEEESSEGGCATRSLGAFNGVFIPTLENMLGVVIFLRFPSLIGHLGLLNCLMCVTACAAAAFTTTTCLAAISSSGGPVSEGGPYFMISRSLGSQVGAVVGLIYWLGIVMLAVMEALGVAETLTLLIPGMQATGVIRSACAVTLLGVVSLVTLCGVKAVSKAGIAFAFIVGLTILATVTELMLTVSNAGHPSMLYMLDNFDSLKRDVPMGSVLGLLFTCFSGIFSGADRADSLIDSTRAIKLGTFLAIVFASMLYIILLLLWSMVASSSSLVSHPAVALIASPWAGLLLYLGVLVTCAAQVMQCMSSAPRILHAVACDRVIPSISGLTNTGALLLTALVAMLLAFLGSLDAAAPLVSMCFLICYAFICVSCLLLTLLQTPTWRPDGSRGILTINATVGMLICGFVMFTISATWAACVIAGAVALLIVINWIGEEVEWGSGVDGVRFSVALAVLAGYKEQRASQINWRPHLLFIYPVRNSASPTSQDQVIRLIAQLKRGKGLTIITAVFETDHVDDGVIKGHMRNEKSRICSLMASLGVTGFAQVVAAASIEEAVPFVLQLSGLGGLRPNTLVMAWPTNWRSCSDRATEFVRSCQAGIVSGKALVCPKNLTGLQDDLSGYMDLWWFLHDGGLLLCLAWLLGHHHAWRHCRPRLFIVMVGVSPEDAEKAENRMRQLLIRRRVLPQASVHAVVLIEEQMIEPYVFESPQDREISGLFPQTLDDLFLPMSGEETAMPFCIPASRSDPNLQTSWEVPPTPAGSPRWLPKESSALLDLLHARIHAGSSSGLPRMASDMPPTALTFERLNRLVLSRSQASALVLLNLPRPWSLEEEDCSIFVAFCECLSQGLNRVIFVHSAQNGHTQFF